MVLPVLLINIGAQLSIVGIPLMPIGLALLSLPDLVDIIKLVPGREAPFGLPPKDAV